MNAIVDKIKAEALAGAAYYQSPRTAVGVEADALDASKMDSEFFDRHPKRNYRARFATQAEVDTFLLAPLSRNAIGAVTLVRQVAPGVRMRTVCELTWIKCLPESIGEAEAERLWHMATVPPKKNDRHNGLRRPKDHGDEETTTTNTGSAPEKDRFRA